MSYPSFIKNLPAVSITEANRVVCSRVGWQLLAIVDVQSRNYDSYGETMKTKLLEVTGQVTSGYRGIVWQGKIIFNPGHMT